MAKAVAKKASAKTAVAKAPPANKTTAVAKAGPAMDFAADAGDGMQNTTADDFAIPFIAILQKGSPQVDEAAAGKGKLIPGAKAGQFFNTATNEVYDEIEFTPAAYQRKFIKWGSRNGPSPGFKGVFTPEQAVELRQSGEVVEVEGKLFYPVNGKVDEKRSDILADTREHYIVLHTAAGPQPAIISLSSTQIKKSKGLNSALANIRIDGPRGKFIPPIYANRVRAKTGPESNDQGSWFGINFFLDGQLTADEAEIYAAAKAFNRTVAEGKGRVNYDNAEQEPSAGTAGNGENWGNQE